MAEDIISLILENVIQGRVTQDDEGLEGGMVGQPGVTELTEKALEKGIDVRDIISKGLTEGMNLVGRKFENKEYYIPDMLDRLWFWCAYGVQDIKMWAITGAADDTLLENVSAKIDFQVLKNNRFTAFFMRGDKNKWGCGAGIRRPPETTWDQTGPSPIYKFSDEHIFSDNFLVTAQYAFVDGGFHLHGSVYGSL